MSINCDQCGKELPDTFDKYGGNCMGCDDDLCAHCAASRGGWNEYGYCGSCSDTAVCNFDPNDNKLGFGISAI